MTCDGARDLFSALVDDALSPPERRELDTHLAGCAECRRELDAFQRTIALVRAAPPLRAPAGFVDRVLAVAHPAPWWVRLTRRVFVPVRLKVPLGAAAVLVIAVIAVQIYRETPELQYAERRKAPVSPTSETSAPPAPPAPRPPATPAQEAAPTPPATAPPARDGRSLDAKAERPPERDRHDEARPAEEDARRKEESTALMKDDARSGRERTAALESRPPAAQLESARRSEPKSNEQRQARQEVVPESRAKSAPASPPAPAASRAASSAPSPVDVVGRLGVKDRTAAETALVDLVARLGGTVVARRAEADATLLEVRVPRVSYGDLLQGLARIGRWTPERESIEVSDEVRLSLRLGS